MATSSTYYLNGPSLDAATSVFLNATLSVLAPDGYYSDGVTSRQQVGGLLLPPQLCGECPTTLSCGTPISVEAGNGLYNITVDIGTDIGATIVKFNPNVVPDGIQINYDGGAYYEFYSQNDGYHSTTPGLPSYTGDFGYTCVLDNSPHNLNEYQYNGSAFVSTGNIESVSVTSGQLSYTDGAPLDCLFVVPKYNSAPSEMQITVISPCESDGFSLEVLCPAPLPTVFGSGPNASQAGACTQPPLNTYYYLAVNGTPSAPAVHDALFTDQYGGTKYYSTGSYIKLSTGHVIQIGANGTIINVSTCP